MANKNINTHSERYKKISDSEWQVSAQSGTPLPLKPITLKRTPNSIEIKPLIAADGIIVEVLGIWLCSKSTLDTIQSSNNPHYDIFPNGSVVWKNKEVMVGRTIPVVKLDIAKLSTIGDGRDIKNKSAGVSYVNYVYEGEKIDGIPVNLINQINYTLVESATRPKDTFGVYQLDLGDDATVYSIEALNVQTAQSDGKLDKVKMETFLTNVNERLKILRNDFNMIKEVFFNSTLPANIGSVEISQLAETNPVEESVPVVFKYSTILKVIEPPVQQAATTATEAAKVAETPVDPTKPKIIQLRMKQQGKRNNIPVFKDDPSAMRLPKRADKTIYEGNAFWGYLYKDNWRNNEKIWMVYEADKTTLIGYGIADSNDYVEEVN